MYCDKDDLSQRRRSTRSSLYTQRVQPLYLLSGVIFTLISLISLSFADSFSLMGRVKNQGGDAISGALVQIKGPMKTQTKSDAQGIYKLNLTQKGKYTLVVSARGYQKYRKTLRINKISTRLDITLSPANIKADKSLERTPRDRGKRAEVGGDHDDEAPADIAEVTSSADVGRAAPAPSSEAAPVIRAKKPRPSKAYKAKTGRGRGRAGGARYNKNRKRRRISRKRPKKMSRRLPPPPPPAQSQALIATSKKEIKPSDMNREEYQHRAENAFKSTTVNPLSTFSIDVDTASYANLRRFIFEGKKPPKGAIRLEEMINYFDYDYISPSQDDPHPFKVYTELAPTPWNAQSRLFHIGLQGRRIDRSKLPPSNLVFLIDVSGSMHGPNRLPLLKQAFTLLASTLRPQDRVSIVVYAGAAGLVLPPTPGDQRQKIIKAFSNLRAGGSTAGGRGIQLAYQIAKDHFIKGGNNRVILATDGDFNVGVSSQSGLVSLIEKKRKTGVFLTVLGFGRGNYQDARMSMLAKKGNGNHAYIDSLLEAQKVLVSEMGGTLFTIAKDVKLQLEFNPNKVKEYRLIGYESRVLAAKDFNDDKKDAGELGAGHSVTALYELIPTGDRGDTGSKTNDTGVDPLKYQKKELIQSSDWLTVKLRYKKPDGDQSTLLSQVHKDEGESWKKASQNFRFSAGVAAFGMQLQGSKYKGETSWRLIEELVSGAKGDDKQGYRAELLNLIKKAKRIFK